MAQAYYFADTTLQANHELRLYEGQTRFDVIYGTVANGNTSATAGVQRDIAPNFTQYFCNGSGEPGERWTKLHPDAVRHANPYSYGYSDAYPGRMSVPGADRLC